MKIKIEITCDNAAFSEENGGAGQEVGRILRRLADRIYIIPEAGGGCALMDINGNKVGEFKVTK
jgi:hypothetical protein